MAQVETQVAASVRYLVRVIITHRLTDIEANFPPLIFCFVLAGMSAIRMARVRSIATRLRAGWCGLLTRSSGRLNCLVALALAGTPRVPPGHCGRSLLVRSSAEFYDGHSYCDYAPGR